MARADRTKEGATAAIPHCGILLIAAALVALAASAAASPVVVWQDSYGRVVLWHTRFGSVPATEVLYENRYWDWDDPNRTKSGWNIVATGDLDGDGMADLLWQGSDGALELWTMRYSRRRARVTLPFAVGTGERLVGAADFTRDGRADPVVVTAATGAIEALRLDSSWAISERVTLGALGPGTDAVLAVIDLDGGGDPDLLVGSGNTPTEARLYDGPSETGSLPVAALPTGRTFLDAADFNRDGVADFLCTDAGGALHAVLLEIGAELQPSAHSYSLADEIGTGTPRLNPGTGYAVARCLSWGRRNQYETMARPAEIDAYVGGSWRRQIPFRDVTKSIAGYAGARGNGIDDDTDAIQRAINAPMIEANSGTVQDRGPCVVYFPAGTYKITRTIVVWAATSLVGDHTAPPVIWMPDANPGFGDPARRRPVIAVANGGTIDPTFVDPYRQVPAWWTAPALQGSANNTFQVQIRNVGIRVGSGNPGAVALLWRVAQASSLRDVRIELGDGAIGIDNHGDLSYAEYADYAEATALVDAIYLPQCETLKQGWIETYMADHPVTRVQAENAFYGELVAAVNPPFEPLYTAARGEVCNENDRVRSLACDPRRLSPTWGYPDGAGSNTIEDVSVEWGETGCVLLGTMGLRSVRLLGQSAQGMRSSYGNISLVDLETRDAPVGAVVEWLASVSMVDSRMGPPAARGAKTGLETRQAGVYIENCWFHRLDYALANHLSALAAPSAAHSIAGDPTGPMRVEAFASPPYSEAQYSGGAHYGPFGVVNGVRYDTGALTMQARDPIPLRARPQLDDDSLVNLLEVHKKPGAPATQVTAKRPGGDAQQAAETTAALQWAVDNYRTVFLPRGVYAINDTIRLCPDTRLVGETLSALELRWDSPGFGDPSNPKHAVIVPAPGIGEEGGAQLIDVAILIGPVDGWDYTPNANTRGAELLRWEAPDPAGAWDLLLYVAYRNALLTTLRLTGNGGGVFSGLWAPTGSWIEDSAGYNATCNVWSDSAGPVWFFAVAAEHARGAAFYLHRARNHWFFTPQTEASTTSFFLDEAEGVHIHAPLLSHTPGYWPAQASLPAVRIRQSRWMGLYGALFLNSSPELVIDDQTTRREYGFGYSADWAGGEYPWRTVAALVENRANPPPQALGFAAWIARFPLGAKHSEADDPDGDGLANFLEYAFDLDPSRPSALPTVEPFPDQGWIGVDYPVGIDAAAHGVTVEPQGSPDLITWSAATTGNVPATVYPGHARRELPAPNPKRGFVRLRAGP